MELKTGLRFGINKYHRTTMTARNSTINEVWEVIEANGQDVKAKLISTNEFMYSGSGVLQIFKDIKESRTYERSLIFF
jgi:hypothetical protein